MTFFSKCWLSLWLIFCLTSEPFFAQDLIKSKPPRIKLTAIAERVDITIDGELFTSYWQPEKVEKPILYPVFTHQGTSIARGYPLDSRPGERVDHPHHIGVWMNHGDVNGLDFWNHSARVKPERKHRYGSILHKGITHLESGEEKGILSVMADWVDTKGKIYLNESTTFVFQGDGNRRWIDRITTLTAKDSVVFADNKEGFFAVRVRRELELPSEKPAQLLGKNGQPNEEKVVDNEGVTGDYLNSEGITGGEVWGKKAKWVRLSGQVDSETVSVVIFDHPQNISFPSHWHARGYGLFSINSLGRTVFDKSLQTPLEVKLNEGESVTFRYRILVQSGEVPSANELKMVFEDFSKQ